MCIVCKGVAQFLIIIITNPHRILHPKNAKVIKPQRSATILRVRDGVRSFKLAITKLEHPGRHPLGPRSRSYNPLSSRRKTRKYNQIVPFLEKSFYLTHCKTFITSMSFSFFSSLCSSVSVQLLRQATDSFTDRRKSSSRTSAAIRLGYRSVEYC
jgi:hypothetical protein